MPAAYRPYDLMNSLNHCESDGGPVASGEREEDKWAEIAEVVWIGQDGDIQNGCVRTRDAGFEL
jgi:hypothetical protein